MLPHLELPDFHIAIYYPDMRTAIYTRSRNQNRAMTTIIRYSSLCIIQNLTNITTIKEIKFLRHQISHL